LGILKKTKKKKGRPRLDPISLLFRTFIEAFEPLREPKPWKFKEELQAPSNGKKNPSFSTTTCFFSPFPHIFLLFLTTCCNHALLAYQRWT
jgi:hypothetical protein